MRKLVILLVLLAIAIAAIAFYLVSTTPKTGAGVRLPLPETHRRLLARVPASAEAFALIPTAAAMRGELMANPVTRDAVVRWMDTQPHLPSPWMLGAADVVVWKSGKQTCYAIAFDPVRAFFVRLSLMFGGAVEERWDGSTLILNSAEPPMGEAALAPLLALAAPGARGDALAVQKNERSGFPPIGRPAVSVLDVSAKEILIVSRAHGGVPASGRPPVPQGRRDAGTPPPPPRFPAGAMLSVSFTEPPRLLADLNRLFGSSVSTLLDDGGAIALYDVDTGTLLPRPKGVIIAPSSPAESDRLRDLARIIGQTRETGTETLVSFDRTSLDLYIKDTFVPAAWPANRWALRIDPRKLVPVLEDLADSHGFRFATPRMHRSARDLRRWIGALQHAEVIEAADSVTGGVEELRVRIASK